MSPSLFILLASRFALTQYFAWTPSGSEMSTKCFIINVRFPNFTYDYQFYISHSRQTTVVSLSCMASPKTPSICSLCNTLALQCNTRRAALTSIKPNRKKITSSNRNAEFAPTTTNFSPSTKCKAHKKLTYKTLVVTEGLCVYLRVIQNTTTNLPTSAEISIEKLMRKKWSIVHVY